ncbi:MAG TPA: ADYC domain-containing protein, partial [Polyangiaceae bacterium]|nr:ADYC domain-containing protein [Polyangiaceae bacterium]
ALSGGSGERLPARCEGAACKPDPSFSTRTSYLIGCPSGSSTCGGDRNGRGIYIANDHNYCFATFTPKITFCPETFLNDRRGGVRLRLHNPSGPGPAVDAPVTAALDTGAGETPIELVSVEGRETGLAITLRPRGGGAPRPASDEEMRQLRLRFALDAPNADARLAYTLKIAPATAVDRRPQPWLRRYAVYYQLAGSTSWTRHCGVEDGVELATSFLGGFQIDGHKAEVRADRLATTMSCVTGAIDSCLAWGYAPWAAGGRDAASGEHLFATCLQAKRAAYFVGRGDPSSYTVSGTEIYKRDPFGINAEPNGRPEPQWVGDLEAIWGPRGALCLNLANRRRHDVVLPNEPSLRLPPCDGAQWSEAGKMATI